MTNFRNFALIVLVALASLAAPNDAFARQVIPPVGGSGDAQRSLECPRGEFLRGVVGRTGLAIDAIQILCAPGHSYREYDPPHPFGDMVGGGGGGDSRAACPDDRAIQSITVGLTAARVVQVFEITCHDLTNRVYFGPSGYSIDGTVHSGQCSGDEQFTGLVVNFGRYVNAIGFICDTVPYMAQGFGSPNPAPAAKPIKHTPRGHAATGGGLAVRASIAGMWDFSSPYYDPRHIARIQIITQGDGLAPTGGDVWPIPVIGIVNDSQGERDGMFNALLQPDRQMIVNFTHKDGSQVTCQLIYSADGQSLGGQCAEKDGHAFQWNGTRAG